MKRETTIGGRRTAESGVCLALLTCCLLSAAGCTGRESPAAPPPSVVADADNERVAEEVLSQRSTDDVVEPSAKSAPTSIQLASANDTDRSTEPASAAAGEAAPTATADAGRTRDVTFDTIKFDMKKEDLFLRTMLTAEIEKLFGTRIRIRGYILPGFQQRGITKFVLVRDNMECCFGPGAALFDCIVVEMSPGKTANFSTRPVTVEGVFSMDEVKYPDDENRHLAIYHLVADKVQ